MTTIDSQGWIDFLGDSDGKTLCSFFLRDGMLWVRKGDRYKCTYVSGSISMPAVRALALTVSSETDSWQEAASVRSLLPSG